MQPMATGWQPEWGLGAYVAGQNAAMQEAANQEEQIKNYLANERERTMQPLDTRVRESEAAIADAKKKDPEYIKGLLGMTIGQGKSMQAGGDKAQALLPFQIAADRSKLQQEQTSNDLLKQVSDLDSLLSSNGYTNPETGEVTPFTPQQRAWTEKKKQELVDLLGNDPKQAAKFAEMKKKFEYDKQLQELHNQGLMDRVASKPATPIKESPDQALARMIRENQDWDDATKTKLLMDLKNAALFAQRGDTSGEKVGMVQDPVTKRWSLGNRPTQAPVQLPSSGTVPTQQAEIKTIGGKQYKKVQGGWQLVK